MSNLFFSDTCLFIFFTKNAVRQSLLREKDVPRKSKFHYIMSICKFLVHIQLPLLTGDLIEEGSNLYNVRETVELSN